MTSDDYIAKMVQQAQAARHSAQHHGNVPEVFVVGSNISVVNHVNHAPPAQGADVRQIGVGSRE